MKPFPFLILVLTAFFTLPATAIPQSPTQDYAVFPAKLFSVFTICFQGDYTWYALGQSDGAVREDTRDGSLRYFGTDDGIPDGTINTVFADSRGVVWFGTGKGVSRWDGFTWTHYSYDSPFQAMDTFDIEEDENGALWFATGNGVRSFDGKKWIVWKNEIPIEGVRRIVIGRNGVKWFGSEKGLSRYDGVKWSTIGPSVFICSVFEDSKGRVWVLYYKNTQEWEKGGRLAVISDGVMSDVPITITFTLSSIGAIGEASDGSMWCGAGREFHVYDGVKWTTVPLGGDRTYQTISCAASAPDGSLWFGGYFNERYIIKNGSLSYAPMETGPVWNYMLSAAVDSRGMKWFGADRGLSRFDGIHWKTFYDRDGLAGNRVNTLATSGEILWCGTDRGLSRYDGASWKTFGVADGLADSAITCLAASRDGSAVWAGTLKGVSRYDGSSWETFTTVDGIPEGRVNALFFDERTGKAYAGTDRGAASFNGNSWTAVTSSPDTVTSILVDSARRLWLGTNKGLLRQDNSVWTLFHQGDGVSNLPDDTITALSEDSFGAVWAGTEHGSVRFDGSSWTVNIKLDKVHSIAADTGGLTWFARDGFNMDGAVIGYTAPSETTTEPLKGTWTLHTNQYGATGFAFAGGNTWAALPSWGGVARIDPISNTINVFTTENGLADNGVSSIASADGGTVWAAAYNGMDDKSWIMRWDGSAWSTFKEGSGNLDRIAADTEGGVWAVSNRPHTAHGAVQRWDTNTGKITLSLPEFGCQAICITPRNKALLSGRWLYSAPDSLWNSPSDYTGLTRIETPYDEKISSVVEDRDGVLWCGGKDYPFGVARFDGVTWKTYTTADGLPSASINSLATDKTGAVWAATNSGATRFDGEKWLTFTPNNSGLKSEIVTKVAVSPEGVVWFGGWDWMTSFEYDRATLFEQAPSRPIPLRIESVFPNPFNASTVIRFSLPVTGRVNLSVYDITGRKVRDLVVGSLPAGDHSVAWNGRDNSGRQASSGVFFARIETGKNATARKMLLLR